MSGGVAELYTRPSGFDIVRSYAYNVCVADAWLDEEGWNRALVDVAGAVVMTGMDEDYIRKLCRLGKLEAYREMGRWLIRVRSLWAWEAKTLGRGRPVAKRRSGELGTVRIWQLRSPERELGTDENQEKLPGLE